MQPLWSKKKSCNLSGQKTLRNLLIKKNHATSWDKKNHATYQDKKNHATNRDNNKKSRNLMGEKIMLSLGPIASKLVHKAPNCSKWHQIGQNL